MIRRVFLTAGIGGCLLPGCLSRNGGSRVGRIAIANFTAAVSFAVTLLESETVVYEKVHRIG